jgi:hypothetical protein
MAQCVPPGSAPPGPLHDELGEDLCLDRLVRLRGLDLHSGISDHRRVASNLSTVFFSFPYCAVPVIVIDKDRAHPQIELKMTRSWQTEVGRLSS